VQEYFKGLDLRQYIDDIQVTHIPIKQQLEIALSIGRGMVYLHRMGMFHGDLKVQLINCCVN
jgi:serine/threonine protein kinase